MTIAEHLSHFKGKTITDVVSLNKPDIEEMMWYCAPEETALIKFSDGTAAIVMADPEGNGPGWLEMVDLI